MPYRLRPAFAVAAAALVAAGIAGSACASARTAPGLSLTYTAQDSLVVATDGGASFTAGAPTGIVPAGTYQVTIADADASDADDPAHMFQLAGPGIDLMTDLQGGDDESELYTETLLPNATYVFRDDDAPGLAPVSFATSSVSVGSSSGPAQITRAATTPVSTGRTSNSTGIGSKKAASKKAAQTVRGTLEATVSRAGRLALTRDGRNVTRLKAGRYRIVVADRSRFAGFVIQTARAPGRVLSGTLFLGRRTMVIALRSGRWLFYSSLLDRKGRFVVG